MQYVLHQSYPKKNEKHGYEHANDVQKLISFDKKLDVYAAHMATHLPGGKSITTAQAYNPSTT